MRIIKNELLSVDYSDIINGKEKEKIIKKGILAKDLFPLLQKTNAYGFEKFKDLVVFNK